MFYFGDRESAQTSVIKNGKLVYNCLKTANLIQNCKDSTLLIEDVTIEANENVNTIYTDSNAVTPIKNCVINTARTVLATNNTSGAPAGRANIVNIENSTLTSTGDSALFASCYQIYNIVNSTITGHYSAMHIMMGKINIDKDSTLACTMEKASLKTVDRLKDQGSGEEPEDGVAIVVRADLYYDASAKTNNLEINIEEGAKLISKSLDNDESEFKANIIVYNCNNAKGYLTDKENVVNQYEKAKEAFATRTDVVYYVLSGDILAEEATTAE